MDIRKLYAGERVSVPVEKLQQGRPWEEPYGTVVGSFDDNGVSVRLDGECATVMRFRLTDIDDE